MKLLGHKLIRGVLRIETGLLISTSKDMMAIGDVDSPVIRNPLTSEPYIPGSSLKGKMRYLLEWHIGGKYISESDEYHVYNSNDPKDPINRIFGVAPGNRRKEQEAARKRGPTRLLVRDAELTDDSKNRLYEQTAARGSLYTEIKQEVFIPRIGGNANPRTTERVPAGAEFNFEIIYRVFDIDDNGQTDKDYFEYVLTALRLVELDGLGGHISRGYGQVSFLVKKDDGLVGLGDINPGDIPIESLLKK